MIPTGSSVATISSMTETQENHDEAFHSSHGDSATEPSLTNSARRLIDKLQGDFRAEGKTNCRDCLRSKTLPCSKVVEVADEKIFSEKDATNHSAQASISPSRILVRTHEILLEEYTEFLPRNPLAFPTRKEKTTATKNTIDTNDDATRNPSSLLCMNRIAAILRFVQLLLLLSKRQQQKGSPFLSTAEINKMIVSLLESWTRGICECTRRCERVCGTERAENAMASLDDDGSGSGKENDCLVADATKSIRSAPIFCYAFYSLLRMNEYIQTWGGLLVPLWKGLCELTNSLLDLPSNSNSASEVSPDGNGSEGTQDSDGDDNDWRNHLPPSILIDAIRVLGDMLREGKERMELEAFRSCLVVQEGGCRSTDAGNARITFQGKFVGFMATQMTHILRVYFSFVESGCRQFEKNVTPSLPLQSKNRLHPLVNDVWRSLLGLRGMAAALQLLHSAGDTGNKENNVIDFSFLKAYCKIAAKVGKCVTGTVLKKEQQYRQILLPGLESLLLSDMVSQSDDLVGDNEYHRHTEYPEDVRSNVIRLSVLARTVGKVSLLQQILDTVNSNGTCRHVPGNVEPILATIEHMHFTSVPQCLSACLIAGHCGTESQNSTNITTPDTIVLGSLKAMARTLFEIELSSPFMASPKCDSFYRLLLRWLAGDAGRFHNEENPSSMRNLFIYVRQQQHPLSRELILSLLYAYVVKEGRDGDNTQDEKICKTKFLSYMTKLLMNGRTRTAFRRNIGALLIRLQSPADNIGRSVFRITKELIEKEFVALLNHHTTSQKLSKKRKRISCGQSLASGLNQQDIFIVSRVLSAGGGISATRDYHQVLRREFNRLSSDCTNDSEKVEKTLLASADRNSFLLAWLERCIKLGPTSSFRTFREITGLDILDDIVQPVLSAISGLKFRLGCNGKGIKLLKKKVILYTAAMRLCATWAIVFGDEGNLPIEKVCLLIKHSISKDPWQQSNIEDANISFVQSQQAILKAEVLNLLGFIGKTIPMNCSDRVLRVIRRAFTGLLLPKDWALSSSGISSVISFGSDLNTAHQHILPHCLPKASMGLFQARASGEIWKGSDADGNKIVADETIFEIVDRLDRQLNRYTIAKFGASSILDTLPSTITSTIAPGSYILEMPTQEDRTALVVFPPGPKSLEDIHYMLGGMGDDPQMTTKVLKRAVVSPGGGFKILLVPSR